jgi:hypothetical protein
MKERKKMEAPTWIGSSGRGEPKNKVPADRVLSIITPIALI